jgi:hypothetical protein
MIEISHCITSDSPDGQPWPPCEGAALWAVVRHFDGRTLWRAIQLGQVQPLPLLVCAYRSSNSGRKLLTQWVRICRRTQPETR